jgi:hypothetical protein
MVVSVGLVATIQNVGAADISFVGNGYVIADVNGAGDTFYDVNNQGNGNTTPSYDLDNTTPFAFTLTITIQQGQSIQLGGELQTFPSTPGTLAMLGFGVTDLTATSTRVSFNEMNLPLKDNVGANDRWQQLASTSGVEIATGLAPGDYLLQVYQHTNTNGDIYNNENGEGGNNWEARITLLPEPSVLSLLAGSSILGASFYLRRRRKT